MTDLEGISQREAAEEMNISQSTISRHLEAVHQKIAKALLLGLGIRIANPSDFLHCEECGHIKPVIEKDNSIKNCEKCKSQEVHYHIHSNDEHQIQSVNPK